MSKNNRQLPATQVTYRFKVKVKTKTGIYDVEAIDTSEEVVRLNYSNMNSKQEPLEVLDVSLLDGAKSN